MINTNFANSSDDKKLSLEKCDVLKVILMLTIIFYHSICLWSRSGWFNQAPSRPSELLSFLASYLNTFHVYVFTFVSGYLFYYLKYEISKYKSFKLDVRKRAKRLLLPYALISLVWVIPFNFVFYETTPAKIFNNFILAKSPAQLWFLVMLFGVFTLFYLGADFFNNHSFLTSAFICIVIYGLGIVLPLLVGNIFQIGRIGTMFAFYYLGFYFRKNKDNYFYKVHWSLYAILHLITFAFSYFVLSQVQGILPQLINMVITPVCSLAGTLMVVTGASGFNYTRFKSTKLFKFLKRHNFVMYMLHQQLIYISISIFNAKVGTLPLVFINILISVVGSAVLSVLLSKIPVINEILGYRKDNKANVITKHNA